MEVKEAIKPDLKKCIEKYGWTINIITGIAKTLNEVYNIKHKKEI